MARLGPSYGNLKQLRLCAPPPAIGSDGTVYVGSEGKKLYAINGKTGVKLWEFETGGGVRSSPAIGSDGTVYVGSGTTSSMPSMARLESSYGNLKRDFFVRFLTSPLALIARFTSGHHNKKLYAINGKTGVKLWEFETRGWVEFLPRHRL